MATSFVDLQGAKGELFFHYTRNPKPRLKMSVYDMEDFAVAFDDVQLARLKTIELTIHSVVDDKTRTITFKPSSDGTINMSVQQPKPRAFGVMDSNEVMNPSQAYCFTGKITKASLQHKTREELERTAANNLHAR